MELWITEKQTENLGLTCRVKEVLYTGRSEFQEIGVFDTYDFGRMLVLDGVFQTSVFDEYVYHESIAHVPLFTHPNPRRVLVIGGGDGGSIREVLRHPSVEKVEMVEIDGKVVELCKQYLPEISVALLKSDPRVCVKIGDGIDHVANSDNLYDVIIVDCSDPIGPGEGLFTPAFYQNVHRALKPDGLFVQQTESPFYHRPLLRRLYGQISALFAITRTYLMPIPLYPGGLHCFTIGSKQYDPLQANLSAVQDKDYRYYNRDVHKGCFALPNFMRTLFDQ